MGWCIYVIKINKQDTTYCTLKRRQKPIFQARLSKSPLLEQTTMMALHLSSHAHSLTLKALTRTVSIKERKRNVKTDTFTTAKHYEGRKNIKKLRQFSLCNQKWLIMETITNDAMKVHFCCSSLLYPKKIIYI